MNPARYFILLVLGSIIACSPPIRYVHEFPHPRVVVHYHPTETQFTLDEVRFALDHGIHALELDLRYRPSDGQIVCNHDSPSDESPSLEQVLTLILQKKGDSTTVNHDDRQFFLVLEPKENSSLLFDGIFQILDRHEANLSTAVARGDPPRGITVAITGDFRSNFYLRFRRDELDRLAIVEDHDYSREMVNLSIDQTVAQWMTIEHPGERGRVNALHSGTDPQLQGRYNVRVWNCHDDLSLCLASGADEINVDQDEVEHFKQMILHQDPRGRFPSLAIRGSQALLTWRGASSNNLYVALGTTGPSGLVFSRQILLTDFLAQTPLAIAPAAALTTGGRVLVAYEGTANQRLWYVSGKFTSLDRFLTFDGREQRLTLPEDAGRLGSYPSAAVGPDGRIIVVYEGTADQKIWYVSGYLNAAGELVGQEYSLTEGGSRRGHTPSIGIDTTGRVIVVYRGTDGEKLWYVSGVIDASGRIAGREFSLTEGDARRGYTPSLAFGRDGRVIVAYQGTDGQKLWYVSGTLEASGRISGQEFALTEGMARRGNHPSVAFDEAGHVIILYEGASGARLWYVQGQQDTAGRVVGPERMLDMAMDRH